MTTIAYDGIELVADTGVSIGSQLVPDWKVAKIHRLHGRLLGLCGDVETCEALLLLLGDLLLDKPHASLRDICSSIPSVRSPCHILFVLSSTDAWVLHLPERHITRRTVPCSIGSGRMTAVRAMRHGRSASQAVMVAAQTDPCTNSTLTILLR